MREIIIEHEARQTVESNATFLTLLDEWLERKKSAIRLNSWESYKYYCDKHIIPYFEKIDLPIREITPRHIQRYIDTHYKGGLSANTLKKHMAVVHGVMQDALRFNIIPYDPSERVTLPKLERHRGKAYTVEQAKELLQATQDEPIRPAIMLGLFLGLRRSEVLGLRWQDVDFKSDTVKIRNTVVKMKTLIEHEKTKSSASKRDLHLMPELKKYLVALKAQQAEYKRLMGQGYHDNGHVCVWQDGTAFLPDYISHRFTALLKKCDLPPIRFHELRHTAGSILIDKGISAKQVQEYLGHEQISTTLDIYTHLTTEGKKQAASVLDDVLKLDAC
ncbi:MAG: site-specific integrase [Oscillospiraceae bacterium]|nr:site-specific integrase [Oscillospiraceae bacterium]